MKRDVVLAAYACSAVAPCTKWAKELFSNEPLVISVPGSGETFSRKGKQWTATGDAFKAAISELAPQYRGMEIGRRALVTYSVGGNLGDQILRSAKERSVLSAYLLEEGLHSQELGHWTDYAYRAANTEAYMVMAHTRFRPPFESSRETNTQVFQRAQELNDQDPFAPKLCQGVPNYIAKPTIPDGGFKVTVGAVKDAEGKITVPARTKVWTSDPLALWENRGNLWRLEYEGDDRLDQTFLAQEVAHRMWHMLADYWNRVSLVAG